ncbi:ABC transporter permease [Psychrosphaera saromensis]|uniref:ABC transporter permease n=1 Tax=Psychrosphaera saromensis TaxID=716813 RepID=A0A2S7UVR9_9GAMM|nr:ABC transporter permease [Psychrosphaera saromensis]PQJ53602.1 hypothetical protein BTO11_07925 [Psychrosphaera saromensis]GHB63940.1 ABC transporter permease [Psychrosphaera saromensis]GLQ15636.1 ABC transporter permease [Psychrosphaera saromensis]
MLIYNYLLSGWRNINHNKLFSSINILGLAIGLAAVTLITLFVRSELSYDTFWKNADTLHRSHIVFKIPGRDPFKAVSAPGPLIHALKKDYPQVTQASRVANISPAIMVGAETFIQQVSLVDKDFLTMFDLTSLSGDLTNALNDPHSLILTKELAVKYFGQEDPIGKTLSLDYDYFKRDYKITAVIENSVSNTQLPIKALALIDENDWTDRTSLFAQWFSVNAQLYFQTKNPSDLDHINATFDDFSNRNFPKLPIGGADAKASDFIELSAMNIKDLHLHAVGSGEMTERGNATRVFIFSAIAVLILIIAIINFMNLSTARASQRAKEVSLRKVMGASRSNLIFQFLGESVLVTFIALAISIGLVELALPFYNEVLNKELAINYASTDMLQITGLALIVGILGGLYPAFVLSNFRPATVLKANKSAESSASVKLRAILVVMQFAVSIGLFISTAVVYSQMQYAEKMNPGFNKDNMLLVHRIGLDVVSEKLDMLVKEISKTPQVTAVTWSNETPGNTNENNTMLRLPGMSKDDALLMGQRGVGYDFFATYEIKVLAGRTYQKERNDTPLATAQIREGASRKSSIVINSSAARRLGFNSASDAIGQSIFTSRGNPNENLEAELEVVGVVDDVHFDSLRATIRPEIYNLNATWGQTLSVRFNGNPDTLKTNVEAIWGNAIANIPFRYSFLRQDVADMYKTEQGQAKMFAAFSGLAIFIACLGLYGLANFTATRRTKEIGIRKVMGASVFDIVKLLLWQFSKPVFIANLIAWPIAYWAMSDWLELFVYRIDNSYILLLSAIAGIGALLIAWITVATNSISVAKANPIKALRHE